MNAIIPPRKINRGRYILDRHKRAARMLGFALAADSPDTWQAFATVMTVRLTLRERGAVTLMMCETLPDEELRTVLHVGRRGAGFPPVPFGDVMGDAELWAAAASEDELRAYLFTSFHTLGRRDRREFLEHANRRANP